MFDFVRFVRLVFDEDGVVSVEYSLTAMLVAMAIIVGAAALGVEVGALYGSVASKFPLLPPP